MPPFKGVAKAALYCAHRTSTVSSCAFCEQEGHLAAPSPPLLLILSIELLHHLIGQIQRGLMIEHNLHRRLVPLVDDRDVPILFTYGLRGRLHFFRVFRHQLTLFLLNLAI